MKTLYFSRTTRQPAIFRHWFRLVPLNQPSYRCSSLLTSLVIDAVPSPLRGMPVGDSNEASQSRVAVSERAVHNHYHFPNRQHPPTFLPARTQPRKKEERNVFVRHIVPKRSSPRSLSRFILRMSRLKNLTYHTISIFFLFFSACSHVVLSISIVL